MISAREIASSVFGAVRLAVRDPNGLGYFDTSLGGFWRSFWASAIVLPAYAVLVALRPQAEPVAVGQTAFLVIEGLAYAIGWLAFPVVMLHVSALLDRAERFVPYIVAVNWSNVVQISVLALISLLAGVGVLPEGLARLLGLVAFLWIVSYQWFVARVGLEVGGFAAAGVVVVDFVLGLLITGTAQSIEN